MVKSILDTDLYKFTTSYAYMKLYPNAIGTFTFVDRNKTKVSSSLFAKIKRSIESLEGLKLSKEELEWCKANIKFIPEYYWEWLSTFRFDMSKVSIERKDGCLAISATDALHKVTLYEVPILAIVSELMSESQKVAVDWGKARESLLAKLSIANEHQFRFSEFGTRRRYSYDMQRFILSVICASSLKDACVGTSNVHFAMTFKMKPMGTHPHEWFMFHGAQFGYKHANYMALDAWQNAYDGDLGIALTDTYTSKVFFRNFTKKMAKLFDGIRHDSGDPYEFMSNAIARYEELGINPMSKTIVFSDGLDFSKAASIADAASGRIECSFGIGTNLTNDVEGAKPSNIVMKLTACKMNERQPWEKTIKLSDVKGKHLGDEDDIIVAKYELKETGSICYGE